MTWLLRVAAACMLAWAPAAWAQTAPNDPILLDEPAAGAQAQRAPAHQAETATPEAIAAAIEAFEAERFGACAGGDLSLTRIGGGAVSPRTAQERQLRSGGVTLYHYTYTASGCGRATRRHNVDVLAHEGLEPLIVLLPVGTTALTSGVLDGVFETIITPMMGALYPACAPRQFKVLEANVTRGAPYTRGATWTETWAYDACGGAGEAVITFTYDGDGLRMTANVTPAS